jgi:hypothetical protein
MFGLGMASRLEAQEVGRQSPLTWNLNKSRWASTTANSMLSQANEGPCSESSKGKGSRRISRRLEKSSPSK